VSWYRRLVQVPAEFDGNRHCGETAPTSLRKEILRSDERHHQPTSGDESSQAKTAVFGLSRVRTELFQLLVIPFLAHHPVQTYG